MSPSSDADDFISRLDLERGSPEYRTRERISIELMTSDLKLKASREGSK